jgi:Flp pilus assembly protein TadD
MAEDFSGLSGIGGSPPQPQDFLRAIDSAMRTGDTGRAMQISAEAAKAGVEQPNVLMLAAYHFLGLNEPDKALLCANRARDIAPRNPDMLNVLGCSLTKLNRIDEALSCFNAALHYAPGSFIIHFNKAT